jgi:hypothetical protein
MEQIPSVQGAFPLKCRACGLPYAHLKGEHIIIQSRHSSHTHINAESMPVLIKLWLDRNDLSFKDLRELIVTRDKAPAEKKGEEDGDAEQAPTE